MENIWTETLSNLKAEISEHNYNTWIKPILLRNADPKQFILEVPNVFYRNQIQMNYADLIRTKVRQISHSDTIDISFVVQPQQEPSLLRELSKAKKEFSKQVEPPTETDGLSPKYVFDSFVVGNSNQFAHAAAKAVAENPGKTYNPLFIYGGVGLGKTHLLCAIGNCMAQEKKGLRIVYRSAEKFMNELINAIRFEKMPDFRARYREADVLLIDDVQFIAGKERTQEEFFHTFNTLHEANKQIVLTSDQYAKDIPDLDERLRSRFQSGLLADIQSPDVETRIAILKKKAASDGVWLGDDVAYFLASQIKSNVRVLEGALIRLAAFSSISGRPITLDLTKELFGTLTPEDSTITVEKIQKKVAEFFNLNVSDLKSARRHKVVALPRQVAMYLSRKLTLSSFPEIGDRFGGKDHTTVMHGVQKVEKLLRDDSPLRNTLSTIEQILQNEI